MQAAFAVLQETTEAVAEAKDAELERVMEHNAAVRAELQAALTREVCTFVRAFLEENEPLTLENPEPPTSLPNPILRNH